MPGLRTPDAPAGATDAAVGHHDQDHAAVAATHAELKRKGEDAAGNHILDRSEQRNMTTTYAVPGPLG